MSRMLPRALMVPPGIPDFYTRRRQMAPGPCTLTGRAWSGWGPITGVEVSVDGGATWHEAEVSPPELGPWAWQAWHHHWEPDRPGEHVLCCRARDAAGNGQDGRPGWNVGGYANPAPHRVPVTVEEYQVTNSDTAVPLGSVPARRADTGRSRVTPPRTRSPNRSRTASGA